MKKDLKIRGSKIIRSIPKSLIEDLESISFDNHQQSLDQINDRGGLSIQEAYCLINKIPSTQFWKKPITFEEAELFLINFIKEGSKNGN